MREKWFQFSKARFLSTLPDIAFVMTLIFGIIAFIKSGDAGKVLAYLLK